MDLQPKGTALGKCYMQAMNKVGVVSWALMLYGEVGYEEFCESLTVPELTLRFRSYFNSLLQAGIMRN